MAANSSCESASTSSDCSLTFTEFKVDKAPPTVYYIPEFFSRDEELYLVERILDSPKPKWDVLSNRRLQNWGGIIGKSGLIADDIPSWLQLYIDKVFRLGVFPPNNKPNHVLINEYLPGQGIMPHVDGAAFFPTITTINLGSGCLLDFYRPVLPSLEQTAMETYAKENIMSSERQSFDFESRFIGSLYLQPRSLVILKDEMYKSYLHGIKETLSDVFTESVFNLRNLSPRSEVNANVTRDTRHSITIRNVEKVCKMSVADLISRKR